MPGLLWQIEEGSRRFTMAGTHTYACQLLSLPLSEGFSEMIMIDGAKSNIYRQLADVITICLKLAIPNCFAVAESVVHESMGP